MQKNEKIAFWVAGGIGVIVLLFLMMYRRSQPANNTAVYHTDSPNYMTYNYPGVQPWRGSANGMPVVPAATFNVGSGSSGGSGDCCGCGDQPQYVLTNPGAMVNVLYKNGNLDNYIGFINSIPDHLTIQ